MLLIIAIVAIWSAKHFLSSSVYVPGTVIADEFDAQIAKYLADNKVDTLENILPFDINLVSQDALIEMGVSRKTAETWLKYRAAIGGFQRVDQIGEIYGMDEEWYNKNLDKFQISKSVPATKRYPRKEKLRRDKFDPNTIDPHLLKEWGFSDHAVNSLRKFREKGGRFHEPADMSFIFGVSEKFYKSIEDLILINSDADRSVDTNAVVTETDFVETRNEPSNPTIDINAANEYEWQLLNGIGPGYAQRILRFRNALGGFISISQVAETYGLPDSVFQKIQPYLNLSSMPRKILINEVSAADLAKHPYISRKKASIVINYRENNHSLNTIEDLYKINIFDTAEVKKLEPYLIF